VKTCWDHELSPVSQSLLPQDNGYRLPLTTRMETDLLWLSHLTVSI
jgi:hypothetical protein